MTLPNTHVEIPRIQHGRRQTLETVINEEDYLPLKYRQKKMWVKGYLA
jgi:hypothetical protein